MGELIPFPKKIMKGRVRKARSIASAAGDTSLLWLMRSGVQAPDNVERLIVNHSRKEWEDGRAQQAFILAIALFATLDESQRDNVRRQIEPLAFPCSAQPPRPDFVASAADLLKVIGEARHG